jgi:hypothetical protein
MKLLTNSGLTGVLKKGILLIRVADGDKNVPGNQALQDN